MKKTNKKKIIKKKKVTKFAKELINIIARETGCNVQHNGSPCNTCFHTWAEEKLNMGPELAHFFWMVLLSLRGDYTEMDLLQWNEDNFKEILKKIK